jgi:hypothetical protein
MMFAGILIICTEIHTKLVNTLCGSGGGGMESLLMLKRDATLPTCYVKTYFSPFFITACDSQTHECFSVAILIKRPQ